MKTSKRRPAFFWAILCLVFPAFAQGAGDGSVTGAGFDINRGAEKDCCLAQEIEL
jgi:hypothetical protein